MFHFSNESFLLMFTTSFLLN